MKIKIKSTSSNSETLNIYKELLKKYNPVETTIEYYAENYNEEDIIYRRGSKKGEEGYQEPYLLIYDGYIE